MNFLLNINSHAIQIIHNDGANNPNKRDDRYLLPIESTSPPSVVGQNEFRVFCVYMLLIYIWRNQKAFSDNIIILYKKKS